jgi:hypothetical protein
MHSSLASIDELHEALRDAQLDSDVVPNSVESVECLRDEALGDQVRHECEPNGPINTVGDNAVTAICDCGGIVNPSESLSVVTVLSV